MASHPLLIAVLVAVFAAVYFVTRSPGLALLALIPIWVGGMAFLMHRRFKPPKASEPTKCYHCDYDLRGLPLHEHRCPECGNRRRYH